MVLFLHHDQWAVRSSYDQAGRVGSSTGGEGFHGPDQADRQSLRGIAVRDQDRFARHPVPPTTNGHPEEYRLSYVILAGITGDR